MSNRRGPYKRYLRDPDLPLPRKTRIRRELAESGRTEHELELDTATPLAPPQCDDIQDTDNIVNVDAESITLPVPNYEESATDVHHEQLNTPLEEHVEPGSDITDPTRSESLLLLEAFGLRHNLSATAFQDLLHLFNTNFPGSVPGTRYLFNKEFASRKETFERHIFCDSCFGYIGKDASSCPDCERDIDIDSSLRRGNYFIVLPLKQQLQDLLQTLHLFQQLRFPTESTGQVYSDINDGVLYQNLLATGHIGKQDLTLVWNSDGVPVFKSSGYAVWPIQCTVNELSSDMRKKHVLLTGIWFGSNKPRMDTFLQPFVTECYQLCEDGFSWVNPITKATEVSCAHMLVCTADAIARPMLRNVKQFNGLHGCDWCLHPGQRIERGDGNARVYPYRVPEPTLRTDESHKASALEAARTNRAEDGVKGPSILMLLPCFGIVSGFVPDYMHSTLLGVTRQLVLMWIKGTGTDWYVGNRLDLIDRKLVGITPPNEITRRPRSLHQVKYWKASEWRAFLLYYALIVMRGFLHNRYLANFFLLVYAIRTLMATSVSETEVCLAELCLKKFVLQMEKLYGLEFVTFNVHQMTHLANSVRSWGPLWATSAFIFEGNNGFLLNQFNGTQYVPQQICNAVTLWHDMAQRTMDQHHAGSPAAHALLQKLLNGTTERKRVTELGDHVTALGPPRVVVLSPSQVVAVERLVHDRLEMRDCECYSRFIFCKMCIYTTSYTRVSKRKNSVVQLNDGRFLQLDNLVTVKPIACRCPDICACIKQPVLLGRVLIVSRGHLYHDRDLHISSDFLPRVKPSNCVVAIWPSAIVRKSVLVEVDGETYVSSLPNPFEYD